MDDNKKNRSKKRIPGEWLIAAVLAAVIVCGVLIAYQWDASKRKSVAGTYSCKFQINSSETNAVTVYYKFDADKGTYEELWGERTLMTGTYTVDDDKITIVSDGNEELGAESETDTFFVKDNLLIPESYIYEGAIPSGDTFDAECTMTDSAGMKYIVSFKEDGKYTYTVKNKAGEDNSSLAGTYEREGDFLHRTNDAGVNLTDFYVYEGRLAGIVYTKE